MSNLPPFQTQYNKIIDAYFKDEIQPYKGWFCFCGTLNNNSSNWRYGNSFYSMDDFLKMEHVLLSTISVMTFDDEDIFYGNGYKWDGDIPNSRSVVTNHPEYENALFEGMVAALVVLKQIHIEHGEVIDEAPVFNKRILQAI